MQQITFSDLTSDESILQALTDMGFANPTEIQAKAIPVIGQGKDVIGKSHTGTGKTVAFGIPALLCAQQHMGQSVLVLCPTRELAQQVEVEMGKLSKYCKEIRTVALYGGEPIYTQVGKLKRGVSILIGTPGRVMDHIERGTIHADQLKMVVLDEADEMLNMGFRDDMETILSCISSKRQLVLFSATMPPAIMELTEQYQNDPVLIQAGNQQERTIDTITQYYYEVPGKAKAEALTILLHAHRPTLSIIFCNTKKMVDELNRHLVEHGFHSATLHGDMKQEARTLVMKNFKSGRTPILIATDVAARGIDVDNVDAVYNYDIPQEYEYYIHRIGRTGRAGKTGAAYTLVAGKRQIFQMRDIARYIKASIEEKRLPSTKEIQQYRKQELLSHIQEKMGKYADTQLDPVLLSLEEDTSKDQLIATLFEMLLAQEMKHIPELTVEKSPLPMMPEKTAEGFVRIRFSVGRGQRVSPNQLVGAITECTSLTGKKIGKIYCYRDYSIVEIPVAYRQEVLKKLHRTAIGGHTAFVRMYEEEKRNTHPAKYTEKKERFAKTKPRRYSKRG